MKNLLRYGPVYNQSNEAGADPAPGSPPSGSGTAPGSNAAPAPAVVHDKTGAAIDKGIAAVETAVATGTTAIAMAEAAMGMNQQAAPTDPNEIAIASLHSRLSNLEAVLGVAGPMVGALVPGAAPVLNRMDAIEAAVEKVATMAEQGAPLLTRLETFFRSLGHKAP